MFARWMGLNVISPGQLPQLMQKEPVSVLDVNSRPSWFTARVPGARPLDPMGYDESDLPADRDSTLVFYLLLDSQLCGRGDFLTNACVYRYRFIWTKCRAGFPSN
jgi:hypothetical protein